MFVVSARTFWTAHQSSTKYLSAAFEYLPPDRCEFEHSATELFGDYNPETMLIRIWMRTAVRKEITSFGTFLSTLCREFCHHLNFQRFRFPDSWHTRGFYERAATLYHYARKLLPRDYSGHRCRAAGGGLIGCAQIAALKQYLGYF